MNGSHVVQENDTNIGGGQRPTVHSLAILDRLIAAKGATDAGFGTTTDFAVNLLILPINCVLIRTSRKYSPFHGRLTQSPNTIFQPLPENFIKTRM
jgi:hypothetical protein